MKFITRGNQVFGGAEAVVQIVRRVWWAWPVFVFSRFPGMMRLMEKYYRHVAANRSCAKDVCRVVKTERLHRVFFEFP
jgi:predicted DCC family thiol-disulfide oxidoreductase YuxK